MTLDLLKICEKEIVRISIQTGLHSIRFKLANIVYGQNNFDMFDFQPKRPSNSCIIQPLICWKCVKVSFITCTVTQLIQMISVYIIPG